MITFKTSPSSLAIPHSAGESSYFRRSSSRFAVILSIAGRKSSAKLSISYVEFQRVATSRGIIRRGRPQELSVVYHCGRRIVVDFFTAYENLRNWSWKSNSTPPGKSRGTYLGQRCSNWAYIQIDLIPLLFCQPIVKVDPPVQR